MMFTNKVTFPCGYTYKNKVVTNHNDNEKGWLAEHMEMPSSCPLHERKCTREINKYNYGEVKRTNE